MWAYSAGGCTRYHASRPFGVPQRVLPGAFRVCMLDIPPLICFSPLNGTQCTGETTKSPVVSKLQASLAPHQCTWTYGLGYASQADARECIPLLEDDPLGKVVEAQKGAVTLPCGDVLELLQFSGECNSRITGFVQVDVPCAPTGSGCDGSDQVTIKCTSDARLQRMVDALLGKGAFQTTADAQMSTAAWLKEFAGDCVETSVRIARAPLSAPTPAPSIVPPMNSLNVQGLVKKRKVPATNGNTAQPLPVMNIQQFVKRKPSSK
jgi:hypothetical protein